MSERNKLPKIGPSLKDKFSLKQDDAISYSSQEKLTRAECFLVCQKRARRVRESTLFALTCITQLLLFSEELLVYPQNEKGGTMHQVSLWTKKRKIFSFPQWGRGETHSQLFDERTCVLCFRLTFLCFF